MGSVDRLNALYPGKDTDVADDGHDDALPDINDDSSRRGNCDVGDAKEYGKHAPNLCPVDCENTLQHICEDEQTARCAVCRQRGCLCTAHCAEQTVEYEQGCARTALCSGYTEVAGFRCKTQKK